MAWGDITPPTTVWGDIAGPSGSYSDVALPSDLWLDFANCVYEIDGVFSLEDFVGTDDVVDLFLTSDHQWGNIANPSSSWSDI